jgi:Protein of unknown function (DUF3592)
VDPTSNSVYLIPFWPILFVAVWAVWNTLRDSREQRLIGRSLNWPETQGQVRQTKVVWAHVEVSYEYRVAARTYVGTYKISLSPVVPDRGAQGARKLDAEAKQDISEFPEGLRIIIRYNPKRPEESVFYCRGEIGQDRQNEISLTPPKLIVLN